jgi:hypothetical protein
MGAGGIRYWAVQGGRVVVEWEVYILIHILITHFPLIIHTSYAFEDGPDRGFRNVGKT